MSASFLPSLFPSGDPITGPNIKNLLRAITALSNLAITHTNTVTVSSSSSTYVNLTNGTLAFTKQYDSSLTDILVLVALGAYINTAFTYIKIGVTDGALTQDMVLMPMTTANENLFVIGSTKFTARNAGSFTLQFQMKNLGSGTFNMDSNDQFSALAWEVPK